MTSALGLTGFDAACLVCKTWLNVCRSDERVLRGVALYQGGLAKSAFMKLCRSSNWVIKWTKGQQDTRYHRCKDCGFEW